MDKKEEGKWGVAGAEEPESDSSIHADEESARLDLSGIFSNKFSNITPIYSSPHGATEIHAAIRYGKRFALKGLKKGYLDDPIHNMCMAKEFEIGITLEHPNIRRTFGLENVDGIGKRVVLEYIDGVPLSEKIAEGTLTAEKSYAIAHQISDAVEYLHSKQIVHRDLKPDNILISHQGGNVKIIDFNLSDRDDYIVLKQPAGSKKYMAPELISPESVSSELTTSEFSDPNTTPTIESDLYSLGVIMKELADASGNKKLARGAKACMNPDPKKRRAGLEIFSGEKGEEVDSESWIDMLLESKTLTYVLSGICILLAGMITYSFIF